MAVCADLAGWGMTLESPYGGYWGTTPLIMGSVRGVRAWRFEKGKLESPHANGNYWTQGEQIARCGNRPIKYGRLTDLDTPWVFNRIPRPKHLKNCMCGFYACYWDEVDQVHDTWGVVGVIEGYGQTALGTLGFRSEKAKIVALAPARRVGPFRYGSFNRPFRIKDLRRAFPDTPVYRKSKDMFLNHPVTRLEEITGSLGLVK